MSTLTHPQPGTGRRVLVVVTVDVMAWKLLQPWLHALRSAGFEVHIACARGQFFDQLAGAGFIMHDVPLRRQVYPWVHVAPLWALYRLIRRERFDAVNTHSPVAAALGRIAAWLAGTRVISYTAHGFYFHENMTGWKRYLLVAMEKYLGRITDSFMFVSDEDRRTALREGIARDPARAATIYNGVDLTLYEQSASHHEASAELKRQLKIPVDAQVVGIVGRVVREKGHLEFAEMAKCVSANRKVFFLVVGDALPTDRDGVVDEFKSAMTAAGLGGRYHMTGMTSDVPGFLRLMNIFVLPSYREGFPRSILEAMSCGLPVVATDIRGCRESVVQGETGLIIPPRNAHALTEAVARLLDDPELARRMGAAGRRRAELLYDEKVVQDRFVNIMIEDIAKAAPAQ